MGTWARSTADTSGSTSDSEDWALTSSETTDPTESEVPVQGIIPRLELESWRRRGVVAGITVCGDQADPADFTLGSDPHGSRVAHRWRTLQQSLEAEGVVVSRQVHGSKVAWHGMVKGFTVLDGLDGHGTADPGTLLAVTVADCIPVFLFDPASRAGALLHAGWRGTANGVLTAGVSLLRREAGARVENIVMHCGPGICGSCYEVGSEVLSALRLSAEGSGPWTLDLRGALRRQAEALGMNRITASALCTMHGGNTFFSHRGSRGGPGRMVAYLRVLP